MVEDDPDTYSLLREDKKYTYPKGTTRGIRCRIPPFYNLNGTLLETHPLTKTVFVVKRHIHQCPTPKRHKIILLTPPLLKRINNSTTTNQLIVGQLNRG